MTTEQQPPLKIRIEPFDPSHHDRAVFSCGTSRIDNFLHRTAKKHQKGDFIRVWVAVKEDEKPILGRGGPVLLDRFAAMLSFVMLFNVMPLFSFDQGHGPDFRFFDYRPHRGFVH